MTSPTGPNGPNGPGILRLGRRAQRRIGGPGTGIVDLGIIAMNPDPADPAARMNVVDRVANTLTAHTVRPGSELRTTSWTLHFIDVVPAGADGYVTFTVRPTAGGGKDRDDVDA